VRKANSREKMQAVLLRCAGNPKALGGHMNTAPLKLAAQGGAEDSAALATAELMRELAAESAFANVMTGPEGVPDIEVMQAALASIPASIGRADWARVVWAVRAHEHEGCYQAAEDWSKGCADKWDPQDFDGVWRAQSRGPAVEAGTLYHIARSHGWKGSLRRQQTSAVILPPEVVHGAGALVATPTQMAPKLGAAPALAVAAGYGGGLDVAGDLTNGVAFASDWRGRLLYVEATKGWMQWTGSRWVACATATVWECAKKTAGRLLVEAANGYSAQPSSNERKAALKAASDLMKSDRRMEAMLHMAQSEGGMWEKDPSVFDNDPMVLACPNGVLNLRTGALVPAAPELRVSRLASKAYNPEATCPGFIQFINDIFLGDAEMVSFMQRQLGYCLTGDVTEEKMFFWYGHGSNGKSVLGEVVGGVMGEYSAQISAALLRRNGNGNTSAAERAVFRLRGARLVQMNELAEGERWDDARLKEITSREPISARQLYGEDFDFIPTHKLVVRGNNKPIIRDDSHGTWRRIVLCGFERQYAEHEKNPHLAAQLVQREGEGILAWLVAGCLEWQRGRLAVPAKVQDLTAAYKADSDVFGQWVSECCDTSDITAETDRKSARANYEAWCTANGYAYPLTAKRMSQKLAERGFPVVYGGKRYQGLRLHPTQH
jgi:putative DNA primase/helicase